jgi:SAM-dependent methyltransferase
MAIWLGVLDNRDLNAVTAVGYNHSGFETKEHNSMGLWEWEEAIVDQIFDNCRTLLVAAAGGGRETIALAKKGFHVTAFDSSDALTSACRTNISRAKVGAVILDAEPDKVPEGLKIYDGLIVGRGAYHHIPGQQTRIRFLQMCRNHLAPGAPIFLDDFHVLKAHSYGSSIVANIARFVRWLRRSPDSIDFGDHLNSVNYYHRFRRDEIEFELNESGFRLGLYAETPWPHGEGVKMVHAIAYAVSE